MKSTLTPVSLPDAMIRHGYHFAKDLVRDDRGDLYERILEELLAFNDRHCNPPKCRSEIIDMAIRCAKKAQDTVGGEVEVQRRVLLRLATHFHIEEEVWGTHWSGKRMRIDAIVKPKDDSGWKTKSPSLGIEFKNINKFSSQFDLKSYTKWWSQCHDYAETKFDGHGYVFVFPYLGFEHYRQALGSSDAAFAVRFWGRLGVGELAPAYQTSDLTFFMQSSKLWSEHRGVRDAARVRMERRFGSR